MPLDISWRHSLQAAPDTKQTLEAVKLLIDKTRAGELGMLTVCHVLVDGQAIPVLVPAGMLQDIVVRESSQGTTQSNSPTRLLIHLSDLPLEANYGVLAIEPTELDKFISTSEATDQTLEETINTLLRRGVIVPHGLHTLKTPAFLKAGERHHNGQSQADTDAYEHLVQAVAFATVTGTMIDPATHASTPCAIFGIRAIKNASAVDTDQPTYAGMWWNVIGGHVGAMDLSAELSGRGSTLRNALVRECQEEAYITSADNHARKRFNPLSATSNWRFETIGYGRTSDPIGIVHLPIVAAVHIDNYELSVMDYGETLAFVRVPWAVWRSLFTGEVSAETADTIRKAILLAIDQERPRVPKTLRATWEEQVAYVLKQWFGSDYLDVNFRSNLHNILPPVDWSKFDAHEAVLKKWGIVD